MSKQDLQEAIRRFEESTGAKVISVEDWILEYEGQRWRPAKDQAEFFCAVWDGAPILHINEMAFVLETYHA